MLGPILPHPPRERKRASGPPEIPNRAVAGTATARFGIVEEVFRAGRPGKPDLGAIPPLSPTRRAEASGVGIRGPGPSRLRRHSLAKRIRLAPTLASSASALRLSQRSASHSSSAQQICVQCRCLRSSRLR